MIALINGGIALTVIGILLTLAGVGSVFHEQYTSYKKLRRHRLFLVLGLLFIVAGIIQVSIGISV
jgi:hypothetical protein